VANGGTDELANLASLCRDCNAGKSAYRFTDYRTVSIAPPGLQEHFAYFKDDPIAISLVSPLSLLQAARPRWSWRWQVSPHMDDLKDSIRNISSPGRLNSGAERKKQAHSSLRYGGRLLRRENVLPNEDGLFKVMATLRCSRLLRLAAPAVAGGWAQTLGVAS